MDLIPMIHSVKTAAQEAHKNVWLFLQ